MTSLDAELQEYAERKQRESGKAFAICLIGMAVVLALAGIHDLADTFIRLMFR